MLANDARDAADPLPLPPDKPRVICHECGDEIPPAKQKCEKCHNADNLPAAMVKFGEMVKS